MLQACATDGGTQALLETFLAESEADLRAAQRLRFDVFAGELGARLPSRLLALDCDAFDDHCDHLLVRDRLTGSVVGTYRILPPWKSLSAGGYYAEAEFDLHRLAGLRSALVELGRACVHPAYRHGRVISLLWAGLLQYVRVHRLEYVIGCASIGLGDGGGTAATVCRQTLRNRLGPPHWRVFPHRPFAMDEFAAIADPVIPPLLKGYLRLGAHVAGAPAWDEKFDTADLLLMLPVSEISGRYVDRLLRDS